MEDVLKLFEQCLKKICGESVEIRINYDKLVPFVESSVGKTVFWQVISQFAEKLLALAEKSTRSTCEKDLWKTNDSGVADCETKSSNEDYESSFLNVDPSLVQIMATKNEMDHRMAAFLRKKRSDIDIQNQREFCNLLNTENEFSCARVDAVFIPRVGQRSHITVTDANRENEIMKSDNITVDTMLHSVPSKRQKTETSEGLSYGVQERLNNIESHLKTSIRFVEHDVYSRLKQLEEKILYLEGLSPEYFSYKSNCVQISSRREPQRWSSEDDYSGDLDKRMAQLKEKLLSEENTYGRKEL